MIGYAPMLNVLIVGIASVDCVQIFSLHGLVCSTFTFLRVCSYMHTKRCELDFLLHLQYINSTVGKERVKFVFLISSVIYFFVVIFEGLG